MCIVPHDLERNAGASGITELCREREMLLDDLMLEIDEHTEKDGVEKDDSLEKWKKLVKAGEEVRNMALNRTERSAEKTPDRVSTTSVPNSSKTTKRISYESDDEATDALFRDIQLHRSQGDRIYRLEEQSFEMDRERVVQEGRRFDVCQKVKRRKLELEERKADLEKEERKVALPEHNEMPGVLLCLANKLK